MCKHCFRQAFGGATRGVIGFVDFFGGAFGPIE
jgi:hypothetical protein